MPICLNLKGLQFLCWRWKFWKCEVLTRQQIHASWTWRSHFRMTFWTMPWSSHSSKSLLELSLIVKSRPDGQSYCVNQTSVSMSMVLTYCSQMLYEVAECFECCFAWVVFKSFCSSHFITRRYTVPQELSMSSKSIHLTTHEDFWNTILQSDIQFNPFLPFNTMRNYLWKLHCQVTFTEYLQVFCLKTPRHFFFGILQAQHPIPTSAMHAMHSMLHSFGHRHFILLDTSNTVSSGFLKESFRKRLVTIGWTATSAQDGSGEKMHVFLSINIILYSHDICRTNDAEQCIWYYAFQVCFFPFWKMSSNAIASQPPQRSIHWSCHSMSIVSSAASCWWSGVVTGVCTFYHL